MSDLYATLRATVTRRLETARAATPGLWDIHDANEGTDYPPMWMVTNDAFAFHNPPAEEDVPWLAVEIRTGGREDAEHVAANDPAAVILACEADLERLEEHRPCDDCAGFEHVAMCHACATETLPCAKVRRIARVHGVEVADA